tara:strand:- start:423 stop:596 length:174 start_codon:yes stop_codon:yes gene_type:complete
MSCIQNDEIKERIMEEIESMTMHDFHYLLEEKLKYQAEELDNTIDELVNILFDERCV